VNEINFPTKPSDFLEIYFLIETKLKRKIICDSCSKLSNLGERKRSIELAVLSVFKLEQKKIIHKIGVQYCLENTVITGNLVYRKQSIKEIMTSQKRAYSQFHINPPIHSDESRQTCFSLLFIVTERITIEV